MKRKVQAASSIEPCDKIPKTEPEEPDELLYVGDLDEIRNMSSLELKSGEKYRVTGLLGEGMFGIVLKVKNEEDTEFAAKLMKKTNEPPDVWRTELDVLERLSTEPHDQILQLLSADQMINPPSMCTENVILTPVLGPSVLDIINNALMLRSANELGVTFPVDVIRFVGQQMMSAMIHLEKIGVYHLDLKPENVYFVDGTYQLGPSGTDYAQINMECADVKIGDFGSAKWHLPPGTSVKPVLVQTQNYRAPEIFMGLPHSVKSDVWSFGAMLCEMYTGQLLFYGTNDDETEFVQFEMMQKVVRQGPSRGMYREAVELESTKVTTLDNQYRMTRWAKRSQKTWLLEHNIRTGDVLAVPLFFCLANILIFDPKYRPTFEEVTKMPFFH